MTQTELIREFSSRTGFTISDSEAFIDILKDCIVKGLVDDGVVRIKNLGSFKIHLRKAHMGYNIYKKEYSEKPEKVMVRFELNNRFSGYIEDKIKEQKEEEENDEW